MNNWFDGRSLVIVISKIKMGCFNFKSFGNINVINDIYYILFIIYNDLLEDGDLKVDSFWRIKFCRWGGRILCYYDLIFWSNVFIDEIFEVFNVKFMK